MSDHVWQFWIDVGGTFTDCLARKPGGQLLRCKVLSSAVTKGRAGPGSTSRELFDPARCGDPDNFWQGYQIRLLDDQGEVVDESTVHRFARREGRLDLSSPCERFFGAGQNYEIVSDDEAPLLAIRRLLGLPRGTTLPRCIVKLGTTKGTNALLTRHGAKCALLTTRGFGDILRVGYQNRPRLFELDILKPEPLYSRVVEITERITVEGSVVIPVDAGQVRIQLKELQEQGFESLAICLLHADRFPAHERIVEEIARQLGFSAISRSSRVAPIMRIVARGDTTVVDAYLNPVLRDYVERLQGAAEKADWRFLTSAGGLVSAANFFGKDSVLSGPAGGVVGFSRVARAAGFERAIGFDMGGTSTDVSRFDGTYDREFETEKAGVRIVAPMMAIETIAAGGGSVCWFDGIKLCVGPQSAGAEPGPACYGRGGPLTVTDLNLFLGRIQADHFPFPLHRQAVEQRLQRLADESAHAGGGRLDPIPLANGLLRIANIKMAQAIRSVSIAKGYDPREYVLVPFGGAAGQHACAIADELGISRILCHAHAGLLSAYGIGLADVTRHRVTGIYRRLDEISPQELEVIFQRLENAARHEVLAEGVSDHRIVLQRSLDLRYLGTDIPITVARPADGDYVREFAAHHRQMYGYLHANRQLEATAARVEAIGRTVDDLSPSHPASGPSAPVTKTVTAHFASPSRATSLFLRDELQPGHTLVGPAIVLDPASTTVIDPGWTAEVLSGGELLLKRPGPEKAVVAPSVCAGDEADPVQLELFNHHFAAIATQMGMTLRNTSSSVNVKERLDFSCALFTAAGDLVVNAPHIPVHLGAMSETVKSILADNPSIRPGDIFVTNDPYRGGSHLPDVTVVTPVHDPESGTIQFFTASRAHHAEIGGITPGSMPPFSRSLADEGVLIGNFKVVDAGQSRLEALGALLLSGPYPTRNVHDNLYDLSAQIAANQQGSRDLSRLVQRHGWPTVQAYMLHIQSAAEQKVRRALRKRGNQRREFTDHLDDGSPIKVAITIDGDSATIDFSGTGPVLPGNLNANRAIVTAAVMYCLRCLLGEEIPLNQGVLAPVRIVVPECLLNPPRRHPVGASAAVAGGNVETSQRVVDVLLGALELAAASQGTMNNLLFGNRAFGYYETICGGAGATNTADGADAVHTHMTNTRLTDPEVLEHRFPVRLQEFSVRRQSGGEGRHRGGDGVVRRIEFLEDLEVSILSQRRGPFPPYGLQGGRPGAPGRNYVTRRDGSEESLPGIAHVAIRAGDTLTIVTPGGGGFGE